MQIKILQDSAARFLSENASSVLTAGGVVGTVATAVLSVRAALKCERIIVEEEARREREREGAIPMLHKEKLTHVWPHVIPPVLVGSATIASIIGANVMSAKRAAVLAAAYGVTQKQLEEYKAKVEEKLGVNRAQKLEDELAQDRVQRTPEQGQILVIEGEVLCFDEPTGRYFKATMERINRAANSVNREIATHGYASAQQFYDELEMPPTTWADGVGWNLDNTLELKVSTVLTPDDRPCLAIDFRRLPEPNYMQMHG